MQPQAGRSEVSLYDPIEADRDGNEIMLIDVLDSDPDVVPDLVGKRLDESRLREKLKRLAGKERQVLELRYGISGGARKTQREIARMLGISRSYVSRIEGGHETLEPLPSGGGSVLLPWQREEAKGHRSRRAACRDRFHEQPPSGLIVARAEKNPTSHPSSIQTQANSNTGCLPCHSYRLDNRIR